MPSNSDIFISIVTPVYGDKLCLEELCARITASVSEITEHFEIILVNDSSPNDPWNLIKSLSFNDERIRGVNLSKNFGQHSAITAGLSYVRGEWCTVMDCDLQDRPEEIPRFFEKSQEGFDVVVGRRMERKDNFLKIATSKLFYVVFNYLTEQKLDNRVANFGIYSRKVIDAILLHREKDRAFGLLATLSGFRRTEIDIEHAQRDQGESAYSFRKRLRLAIDLTLSHSLKPLKLTVKFGFFISFVAICYAAYLVARYLSSGTTVDGWTSLMVSQGFLFGTLISVVGIVGLYVGKTYEQVKYRPLFIVRETTFDKELDSE